MEREFIEFVTQVQGDKQLEKLGGIVDELMKKAQEAGVNVDDFAEIIKYRRDCSCWNGNKKIC